MTQCKHAGSRPNDQNEYGVSPVMWAASRGHGFVVSTLATGGANVNLQDKWGYSSLMYGCKHGHQLVVQILLHNKADPRLTNQLGRTALTYAVEADSLEVIQQLLATDGGIDVNATDNDGAAALDITNEPNICQLLKHHDATKMLAGAYNRSESPTQTRPS